MARDPSSHKCLDRKLAAREEKGEARCPRGTYNTGGGGLEAPVPPISCGAKEGDWPRDKHRHRVVSLQHTDSARQRVKKGAPKESSAVGRCRTSTSQLDCLLESTNRQRDRVPVKRHGRQTGIQTTEKEIFEHDQAQYILVADARTLYKY